MGLLDKASRGFTRSGEETVRVVDYDSVPEEDEVETPEKQRKSPRAPRETKPPRERKRLNLGAAAKSLLPEKRALTEVPPEFDDDELLNMATTPTPMATAPVKQFVTPNTAFEIEDDEPNFYQEKQKQWEGKTSPISEDLLPKDGAIQDVLDVLKIPATFTIRDEVLMPGDFDSIEFDVQVPQGYDVGQVQFFVERAESSIQEYMKLLESRNEHIAKLATTIDRLQVDANNLKYDSQIAAGIGIIPTSESVDIENENMELKLQLQKFKDGQKTTINSDERKIYEEMRNELSKVLRDNEDLAEKNYELKNLIAQYEENADEMVTAPSEYTDHESADLVFNSIDNEESLPSMPAIDDELPELSIESMPDFSMPEQSLPKARVAHSSFDVDDDSVDDLLNSLKEDDTVETVKSITLLDDDNDEDDDELDKLMRDWKS